MQKNSLDKIALFLQKHHVMTLATSDKELLSACNLFYAYDGDSISFVVASSDDTTHIRQIMQNPKVAGAVVLETKTVAKIEGVQFRGEFLPLDDDILKKLYFKNFPYALAMNPKLWQIRVDFFKLTNNTLGFGKKLIWQRDFS
jgi:uncharacterized protein YhbP (UPF0306 family)